MCGACLEVQGRAGIVVAAMAGVDDAIGTG
jgi:hypothetical protein